VLRVGRFDRNPVESSTIATCRRVRRVAASDVRPPSQACHCSGWGSQSLPELNVPRSTARGWIRHGVAEVVTAEEFTLDASELLIGARNSSERETEPPPDRADEFLDITGCAVGNTSQRFERLADAAPDLMCLSSTCQTATVRVSLLPTMIFEASGQLVPPNIKRMTLSSLGVGIIFASCSAMMRSSVVGAALITFFGVGGCSLEASNQDPPHPGGLHIGLESEVGASVGQAQISPVPASNSQQPPSSPLNCVIDVECDGDIAPVKVRVEGWRPTTNSTDGVPECLSRDFPVKLDPAFDPDELTPFESFLASPHNNMIRVCNQLCSGSSSSSGSALISCRASAQTVPDQPISIRPYITFPAIVSGPKIFKIGLPTIAIEK
jgi:hypothetical protein